MIRFLVVVGVFLITCGWGQTLLWQTNLNSLIVATPTAYNGNIYVATYRKEVLAFSPEGTLLFRVVGNAPFTSSPLVLSNYLYITSLDGVLYAIDAENGTILWKVALPESFSSPLASQDNLLYTGSVSNTLYAITANTGITQWYAFLKGSVYGRPYVDEESVYVGDFGGFVSRFDRKGQLVWQTNLGGKFFASPVKWNNLIFIGSSTGNLYALTTTGTIAWQISNTKPLSASPVIYKDSIIVGGYDGYLSRLVTSNGQLLWQTKLSNVIEASPVLGGDKVYVADYSGRLFCVDAETGSILWEYSVGGSVRSSPILVNGKIVIATVSGMLSVIQVAEETLTAGPSLNPWLTGKEITPVASKVVAEETAPLTNEITNEAPIVEIPPETEVVSLPDISTNVVVMTNFVTNTIVLTNRITITNAVERWQPVSQGRYVIQVGAFRNRQNSYRLIQQLKKAGWNAFEQKVKVKGKTYYRVRVGYFATIEEAYKNQRRLEKYHLPTMIIRNRQ